MRRKEAQKIAYGNKQVKNPLFGNWLDTKSVNQFITEIQIPLKICSK